MPNHEKIVELNIHGYPKTGGFNSYSEWLSYAKNRLSLVKGRMTIKDFLKRDQFLKTQRDSNPEPKSITDFKKTPIKYNLLVDILDIFRNSLRIGKPVNSEGSRVLLTPDEYEKYRGYVSLIDLIWEEPKTSDKYKNSNVQRREFGFREKIMQGYPNYSPDRIGWGETSSKVIAGFVTVGDGVFSGIPPHHDLSLDKLETRRQSEYGYGRVTGKQIIPTGLCFIQDETAAIGIHVGSDVRFLWHPKMYDNLLSNASVSIDQMHTGATVIPKADYRQFLRVGDFVIVEVGIRLKYWNSLLGGNNPLGWHTLFGYGELYDRPGFVNVYIPGTNPKQVSLEVMSKISPGEYSYNPPRDEKNRDLKKKTIISPPNEFKEIKDKPVEEGVRNVIDHPWSTGTPIPTNTGMPFIMTEEFAVDSTDRKNPFPKEIKVKDLRDLSKVFNSDNYLNKGSELRGQLVTIKNLQIVEIFQSWRLEQQEAIDSSGKKIQNVGVYSSSIELTAPVLSRQENPPIDQDYDWPRPVPEHLFFNDESHEFWLPRGINFLFDLPQEVVLKYFPQTNPASSVNSSNQLVPSVGSGISPNSISYPNHISGDYKYWKHDFFNFFGVDPSNMKLEMFSYSRRKGPAGLSNRGTNRHEWSTPPSNQIDIENLRKIGGSFYERLLGSVSDQGWSMPRDVNNSARFGTHEYFPTARNGARYSLRLDDRSGNITYNLGQTIGAWTTLTSGGERQDFLDFNEIELDKIVENSWPDRVVDYSRMGLPYYKFGKHTQPFPITIDRLDGGYWFTNPDIPKPAFTPKEGYISDRKTKDLWRHDTTDAVEGESLTSYINRYENYCNIPEQLVDRHPIDFKNRKYSVRTNNDFAPGGRLNKEQIARVQFLPNKVYYAADEDGFVIPIRINANTEIGRFRPIVPTGSFDVTGIVWQYSMGQPGLEWEREGYIMQIWPRFLSDITNIPQIKLEDRGDTTVEPPVEPPPPPPPPPTPPRRLPDIPLELSEITLQQINMINCDFMTEYFNSQNTAIKRFKDDYRTSISLNWPIEFESDTIVTRRDPISGKTVGIPKDSQELENRLNQTLYPCEGLMNGQEVYIIVSNENWYGLSRTFFFRKDENGNCTCLLVPRGTNTQQTQSSQFM